MPCRIPFLRTGALAAAFAAGLVAAPLAAQAQTGQPAAPTAAAPGAEFSQQQLESYAAAVVKVQAIDQAWKPQIQQAETPQQAEQMTMEATQEMVGEIQAEGLTVQEYNAITQAAERDRALYDRIVALLAETPR
ncbi:MAG: DUF4168 domain-containing protein [Bacteroidota bacterium]|nr:DUF4168 domain-containing protein [Kiloniellaceae bacterium]